MRAGQGVRAAGAACRCSLGSGWLVCYRTLARALDSRRMIRRRDGGVTSGSPKSPGASPNWRRLAIFFFDKTIRGGGRRAPEDGYSEKSGDGTRRVSIKKRTPPPLQLADLGEEHRPVAHRRLDAQLAHRARPGGLADAPRRVVVPAQDFNKRQQIHQLTRPHDRLVLQDEAVVEELLIHNTLAVAAAVLVGRIIHTARAPREDDQRPAPQQILQAAAAGAAVEIQQVLVRALVVGATPPSAISNTSAQGFPSG